MQKQSENGRFSMLLYVHKYLQNEDVIVGTKNPASFIFFIRQDT